MSVEDPFERHGEEWWVPTTFMGETVWGKGPTKQLAIDDLAKAIAGCIAFDQGDPVGDWSAAHSCHYWDKDFDHG